jgi:predicted PurR-regulated permease PerM
VYGLRPLGGPVHVAKNYRAGCLGAWVETVTATSLWGGIPEPERAIASPPKDISLRSVALAFLVLLACAYALHWAGAVFIPLLLGLMLSYALTPVVDRLERWRLPRVLGAAGVLSAVVISLGSMAYSLSDDAAKLAESLPEAAQKLGQALRPTRGTPVSTIDNVQEAATNLEQAAKAGTAIAPPARGVTRVQIEQPRVDIKQYLWSGTIGLASLIGQVAVVFFIAFFLLTTGDSFRRKIVKITGPTFAKKRVTVEVMEEISAQIQRYMVIQVSTSVLVGLATWGALWGLGLERAAVWGLVAALLNLVPYLGAIVTAAGLALVAFLQFGSFGMAALIGGVSMLINTIEGNLITHWLAGQVGGINPLVIFVGVLAFGWLWGIGGLLLGTPLIMVAKSICDHVDDLKPVAELLGE